MDWESSEGEEQKKAQKKTGRITLSSPNTRRAAAVRFFWVLFGFALPIKSAAIQKRVNTAYPAAALLYARSKCKAKGGNRRIRGISERCR